MKAHGQAMAEFAVACAVLALLLLGLPLIARYHDIQFGLISAARAAATLQGWSPGQAVDVERLRGGALLRLDDPRRPEVQQLTLRSEQAVAPGTAAAVVDALLEPLFVAGALGSGAFDLNRSGYQHSTLSARVAAEAQDSLPQPFAALQLQLREHHAVLTDGWNSSGPEQVAARVGGLVPTASLAAIGQVLGPARAAASVVEPALRRLCLGQIDPEKVPADRLGAVSDDTPRSRWSAPC
ncbi:MAG: hypothetical protein QM718_01465 [Steroidobacteraceae bacterium]